MSVRFARALGLFAAVATSLPIAAVAASPQEDPSSRPPLKTVPAPEPELRSPTWVGEHVALDIGIGGATGSYAGGVLSVGARAATLLQIVDAETRLYVGTTADGTRVGGSLQINAHPAFIAVVWRNLWGVIASGLHGYIGAGVTGLTGARGGFALPVRIGAGLDVPLMGLERRAGLWLTTRTGWRWLTVRSGDTDHDGSGYQAFVGLGWRWYDVFR